MCASACVAHTRHHTTPQHSTHQRQTAPMFALCTLGVVTMMSLQHCPCPQHSVSSPGPRLVQRGNMAPCHVHPPGAAAQRACCPACAAGCGMPAQACAQPAQAAAAAAASRRARAAGRHQGVPALPAVARAATGLTGPCTSGRTPPRVGTQRGQECRQGRPQHAAADNTLQPMCRSRAPSNAELPLTVATLLSVAMAVSSRRLVAGPAGSHCHSAAAGGSMCGIGLCQPGCSMTCCGNGPLSCGAAAMLRPASTGLHAGINLQE